MDNQSILNQVLEQLEKQVSTYRDLVEALNKIIEIKEYQLTQKNIAIGLLETEIAGFYRLPPSNN